MAASAVVLVGGGLYINDVVNSQEAIPQRYDLPKLKGTPTPLRPPPSFASPNRMACMPSILTPPFVAPLLCRVLGQAPAGRHPAQRRSDHEAG